MDELLITIQSLSKEDQGKLFTELSLRYEEIFHTSTTYLVKYNDHTVIYEKAPSYEDLLVLVSSSEFFRELFQSRLLPDGRREHMIIDINSQGEIWCSLCNKEVESVDSSFWSEPTTFDCRHGRYHVLSDEDWITMIKHNINLLTIRKIVDG